MQSLGDEHSINGAREEKEINSFWKGKGDQSKILQGINE